MYHVKGAYGYVRDFDGSEYLWTENKAAAWRMTLLEANLAYGRLFRGMKILEIVPAA